MLRNWTGWKKIATGMFLGAACMVGLGAGVSGIFTQVTSVNGYQVNGAAGANGQVLASNGTYYASPVTLHYQAVASAGTAAPQEPEVNFIGATCVDNSGASRTDCTIGTGTGRTCNANGCYKIDIDGTIWEWVNTPAPNNVVASVTLPYAIPTAVMSIVCSDNGSRVQSGNDQPVGANVAGLTAPFSSFYINSPATGMNAYCTITGY